MRKTFYICVFALISFSAYCQEENYLNSIATESCTCINALPDTLRGNDLLMQVGVCMIKASKPYENELKRDHNIDFSKIATKGEKLGELIGVELAFLCPNTLLKVSGISKEVEETEEMVLAGVEGEVIEIDNSGQFVVFTIETADSKKIKVYWLDWVETEGIYLEEAYLELKGKQVYMSVSEEEMFDPRLGEYRNIRVLTYVELLE